MASECLNAAVAAIDFITKELFDPETSTLYRIYRDGRGGTLGLCDDYAFFVQGLIDLYESSFNDSYLEFADALQKRQIELFTSPDSLGFYTTPSPQPPDLILRLKSGMDAAEPSSNNVTARNLFRLSSMLDDDFYLRIAGETIQAFEAEVEQSPYCFSGLLGSVVMGRLGVRGVVLTGPAGHYVHSLKKFEKEYCLAPL